MRTRHLDENGEPRYTNRLLHEDSPYLVQHAHNPVDWYPWGDEAFEKAQAEDKPIFLSIGYSTCHWCHVMEEESFDDEQVAAYLNEHFISIKLDREQRPDLDDIYMTGLQLLTGQGGWPMSNFLTHRGKPFFAGTYYPREQFMAILQRIVEVWNTQREDLLKQAQEITDAIAQYTTARTEAATIDEDLVARATGELLDRFDSANGGFGGAPKFPNESIVLLMFEDWFRNANRNARDAAIRTLEKMSRGGIYDQIAGGFHRYAVDERWLVPHFEKMLYNQAQLVRVYLAGYAATGNMAFRRVVTDTVDYVLRDMTDDRGRFYSATDADSEGEEGRFFVWTPAEIDEALTPRDARLVKEFYGVTAGGNFEGKNILHLEESLDDYAGRHGLGLEAFLDRLDGIRQQLYEVREKQVHPLRDEKIITAWNGMMITAIALAGHRLGEERFLQAAATAAGAVWDSVVARDAGLYRIVMDGQASIPGNLEDYACLAEALLTLYAVSEDDIWLERAGTLVADMLTLFRDTENGGFWFSRETGDGPLILRPKSPMDGATPSGNSVALNALVMLSRMKSDPSLDTVINESLSAYAGLLKASPSAFAYMVLAAADFLRGPVSSLQFAAGGQVRVDTIRKGATIAVDIAIAEGWHINAHESGDAQFPGTRLAADEHTRLDAVHYPPGKSRSTGFHDKPLNLYEGTLSIEAHLADSDEGAPVGIKLHLQACSDERCLAPETLQFRL